MSLKTISRSLLGLFLLALGSPVFAQATTTAAVPNLADLHMGVVALGIAAGLCGIGMGMGLKGTQEGVARNPGAAADMRTIFFIGFAFIESLTLYTLVLAFLHI